MEILVLEAPLAVTVINELADLWEPTFDASYDQVMSVLAGDETELNRNLVYLIRDEGKLVGTSHLTISKVIPGLGGLGEVVTVPSFRGRGIAARLCARARDDFLAQGGHALFLGTVNPAAARIYHRLGWRKLAGTTVMACTSHFNSPEAFLVDHFRDQDEEIEIVASTPALRILMIPLIVMPHDWWILDSNLNLFSTRYVVQHSCMGLYPRFQDLLASGRGAGFGARSSRGVPLGLATARIDDAGACQVDGFVYQSGQAVWSELLRSAIRWGVGLGSPLCWAALSTEDEEKRAWFAALDFREVGEAAAFDLDGRSVPAVRLEYSMYGSGA